MTKAYHVPCGHFSAQTIQSDQIYVKNRDHPGVPSCFTGSTFALQSGVNEPVRCEKIAIENLYAMTLLSSRTTHLSYSFRPQSISLSHNPAPKSAGLLRQ